jgi:hypothetical protein
MRSGARAAWLTVPSLAGLLAAAAAGAGPQAAPPQPGRPQAREQDVALEEAIRLVQRGDFEGGALQLDTVARRLAAEGTRPADLARAYLYLSIAYLGLSQVEKAKARFVQAWSAAPGLEPSPAEFPPRVLAFFDEVRREAGLKPPGPLGIPFVLEAKIPLGAPTQGAVRLDTVRFDLDGGELRAEVEGSCGEGQDHAVAVEIELLDAAGQPVGTLKGDGAIDEGEDGTIAVTQKLARGQVAKVSQFRLVFQAKPE